MNFGVLLALLIRVLRFLHFIKNVHSSFVLIENANLEQVELENSVKWQYLSVLASKFKMKLYLLFG